MRLFRNLFSRQTTEPPAKKSLTITFADGVRLGDASVEPVDNSAVASVLRWTVRALPEANLEVRASDGAQDDRHVANKLLAQPNPFYDLHTLLAGIATSLVLDGNAYVLKVRNGRRQPAELWYLPHTQVSLERDRITGLPTGYSYTSGVERRTLALEDVIHIKDGVKPGDPLLGWSGLSAVIREVLTDSEAAAYSYAILRNMGVPGVLISAKSDAMEFDDATADYVREKWRSLTRGDSRGETIVISTPVEVSTPGFTPEQLNLDRIRQIPERRICAVLGVPPVVVGLGEEPTYSNYATAREAAYEAFLAPLWRLMARALTHGLREVLGDRKLEFDLDSVRALQEDLDKLHARAREDYKAGLVTREEARAIIGLESKPADAIYFTDLTIGADPGAALKRAGIEARRASGSHRADAERAA